MPEVQSLVTIMPWTFIATICNLLILMAGIKHFLFKPVQKVLDQRAQEVKDTYDEAEAARADAQAMQAEYQQRLTQAKSEANEIIKTAGVTAAAQAEQLVDEAQKEVMSIKRRAEEDIEAQRRMAAGQLKNDISALALELAGKVVEKELDGETQKDLIDSFIDEMGDLT